MAGIALLATLLVGIVLAAGKHGQQFRLAGRKLEAARAADTLFAEWLSQPSGVPREASGTIRGQMKFSWQTRPSEDATAAKLGLEIIRVEIREASATSAAALVTTELVVPATAGRGN